MWNLYCQYPNMMAYRALGNRVGYTNFGGSGVGSPQIYIKAEGYPEHIYDYAQGFGHPNHISQWNPLFANYGANRYMMTDPALINKGLEDAYNYGYNLAKQAGLRSSVQTAITNINGLESQVSQILEKFDDKLEDSQKEKLQDLLTKIQELKAQIANMIKENSVDTDKIKEVQDKIEALMKEASEVAEEIREEIKTQTEEENDVDFAEEVEETETEETEEVDTTTPTGKKQEEIKNEAIDICQQIYAGSIGCVGTNYNTIKLGTDKITKDNVTQVLNSWNEQYRESTGQSGLIETLFSEEMVWNPSLNKPEDGGKIENPKNNMDIIWNIVKCLDEKAQELGIKNKLAGQFAVAYDELDDTFVNQSAVQNAVTKILEEVTKAETVQLSKDIKSEKAGKTKQERADKKTVADKKKAEKEEKAKETFLNDLREILGDENAQISEKVQYENGKFTIRIMGKSYYGKDYLELAQALEKADLDPAKYLKKTAVAQAA